MDEVGVLLNSYFGVILFSCPVLMECCPGWRVRADYRDTICNAAKGDNNDFIQTRLSAPAYRQPAL
ncbi:MAG: hypothetical protein JRC87_00740 [Deltaproteobacteria bacterium]|nr:hypothetical protein [Deltaproteobacteria bacterium]